MCTHTINCSGNIPQGNVAATRPLVCAHNFWHVQHEFLHHVVPATCCTKFDELNFVQHVAGTKQLQSNQHTRGDVSLRHVAGTCPRYNSLRVYTLWFCCCYMSPLHFPSVWTTHDFVAAPCRCDVSLGNVPTWAETFKSTLMNYFEHGKINKFHIGPRQTTRNHFQLKLILFQ